MKTQSFIFIGLIAFSLIAMSFYSQGKGLFMHNGNYVVQDNFVIKGTKQMAAEDIAQLIALDQEFAKKIPGNNFLTYLVTKQNLLRVNKFDKITRLTRFQRITKFNDINRGCLETANIDWAQYGDLKQKLDGIFKKYEAKAINGTYAIYNNQVAIDFKAMSKADITSLNKLSKFGVDEVNICGDYMGVKAFNHFLTRVQKVQVNQDLLKKTSEIMNKY
jgi:hypothetical protein